MPESKTCTGPCGRDLPLSEYYWDSSNSRHLARCSDCHNDERKRRRELDENARLVVELDESERDQLAQFAAPIERECLEALKTCGAVVAAAESVKLTPALFRAHLGELRRRAATRGWSPANDMTKTVPVGYHVKGVSTYYDQEGNTIGQWVKTQKDPYADNLVALHDALRVLLEPYRGVVDPTPPPTQVIASDFMSVIPIGDPHIGMYAWAQETGAPFDLEVAERNMCAAVDKLVDLAPDCEECVIVSLGDTFHADSPDNRTARSGHALDVDTRWGKVLQVGIRIMQRCIDRALERFPRVRFISAIGNHDDNSAVMLGMCLAAFYSREPRVFVDTTPGKFHWIRFGECLIGVTHGDTVKKEQLGPIMATDRPKDWGETKHRMWLTGHIHHDSRREYPGVVVESFRTLAARDAWHTAAGYRSGRDLHLDVWHSRWGRIARHTVGINQLEARA